MGSSDPLKSLPGPADLPELASRLFEELDLDRDGLVSCRDFLNMFETSGFLQKHPQISWIFQRLANKEWMNLSEFGEIVAANPHLVESVVSNNCIIPDFRGFIDKIAEIYEKTKGNQSGKIANYIPQLARANPENYGVSICTVDGQMYNIGNTDIKFTLQSVSKTITYILALEEHGADVVHRHVGEEPSGRGFNEATFNRDDLPFNPMTNAGAIMCASLIKADWPLSSRLEYVIKMWNELGATDHITFNAPTYLSEQKSGDRNYALGYLMNEKKIFPPNTNLMDTLQFYFQCCSIESDCEILATVAATLAKAGVSPISGDRIIQARSVVNCLTLMYSCGMYDFSGEFAFTVGLPAKSGVSGCMMIVIPAVLGIAIYSPLIDRIGNSVRGVNFCKELIKVFNFHNWDHLLKNPDKIDPCRKVR